ncbi:hypothetical protein ACIQAC_18925 [Streptomyces sp. NPDC088387]|uniref:hypothetical protein n=1 Tax=Streptomyces sp. NPDC088387 TaxID=3365859 RepID=UPI00380E4C99
MPDGIDEIRGEAAARGRLVRITTHEPDGRAWPLFLDVAGSVITLDQLHTRVPAPEPAPAPAVASSTPALRSAPMSDDPEPTLVVSLLDLQLATETHTDAWAAPLPAEYGFLWTELTAHINAGEYNEAIATADYIETALGRQYGWLHPHTVNVLTVRAWLSLFVASDTDEWAETAARLIETTQRRQAAGAPEDETHRTIRNAHAVWMHLTLESPRTARELAELLLTLLPSLPADKGHAGYVRSVVHWIGYEAA